MWTHLETKIEDWEKRLVEIRNMKGQDYLESDREHIDRDLSSLKAEKRAVQIRLRKIEELIAKTRVLTDDLNEDRCHDISAGHSLAAVGESLREKFGQQLKESHDKGLGTIRDFLGKRYNISKGESRDLFSLMEETGIVYYWVDIPEGFKNAPLVWHPPEVEDVISELNGRWQIRA